MNLTALSSEIGTGVVDGINGATSLVSGFAGPVTELLVFLGVTGAIVGIIFLVVRKIRG